MSGRQWFDVAPVSGNCFEEHEKKSQLHQDMWAAEQNGCKKRGFYVDMGSGHGTNISNTVLLDQKYGWDGLCIDANPRGMEERSCAVESAVLYDKSGKTVTFKDAAYQDLAGISEHIKGEWHRNQTKNASTKKVVTKSVRDVFRDHTVPPIVDYLNVDVEGAEFNILQGMVKERVFENHCFRNISLEHNFVQPERDEMRKLLEQQKYTYVGSEAFDDYYTGNCG